jgi:hypothetical protein
VREDPWPSHIVSPAWFDGKDMSGVFAVG